MGDRLPYRAWQHYEAARVRKHKIILNQIIMLRGAINGDFLAEPWLLIALASPDGRKAFWTPDLLVHGAIKALRKSVALVSRSESGVTPKRSSMVRRIDSVS